MPRCGRVAPSPWNAARSWIIVGVGAALSCCVGASSGAGPEAPADPLQRPEFRNAPLPREILQAWNEYAEDGGMGPGSFGFFEFVYDRGDGFRGLPSFSMSNAPAARFDLLPHPGRAFGIRMDSAGATDEELRALQRFNTLEMLELSLRAGTPAEALRRLEAFPRLEQVVLKFARSAEELRAVSRIPRLRVLGLAGVTAPADAFDELAAAKGLRALSLNDREVTDAVVPALARIPALEALHIRDSEITAAGLAPLAGRRLKRLQLPEDARTPLGFEHYLAALAPDAPLELGEWRRLGELLPQLEALPAKRLAAETFHNRYVEDADLGRLAAIPGVERFTVYEARDGRLDARLAELTAARGLRWIELDRTLATAQTARRLAELHGLEEVVFTLSDATQIEVAALGRLPKLRVLTFVASKVPPEVLKDATAIATLEELSITGIVLGDDDVASLAAAPRLKRLHLDYCRGLTDAVVPYLVQLPALEAVSVRDTAVTSKAMRAAGFEAEGRDFKRRGK